MVVIDPPFITEEVWRKYGIAGTMLRKEGSNEAGKVSSYATKTY